MKKYQNFLSESFQFFEVKFSIYLNKRVFLMSGNSKDPDQPAKIYSLIRNFAILRYVLQYQNDYISGQYRPRSDTFLHGAIYNGLRPVVQSIVSLTSSLVIKCLLF